MKRVLLIILLSVVAAVPAYATDVGVSISIGEPGFYGRIDIGNAPRPELIYPKPVVIRPVPGRVVEAPIYLHVPPGHEKHWEKHCAKYNACGRPVYFVRDRWYNDVYVPHYRTHREEYRRAGHDGSRDGRRRDDRHDREQSGKREHGRDRGGSGN